LNKIPPGLSACAFSCARATAAGSAVARQTAISAQPDRPGINPSGARIVCEIL
jgi:hypothetical protein